MSFINYNGRLAGSDEPVIQADNQSYRYGYGLFETIKMKDGQILLKELHFERLVHGMKMLALTPAISMKSLEQEIRELCEKNKCVDSARIRLSVSAGRGVFADVSENISYLIEAFPLTIDDSFNSKGLVIDIFPGARKSCDDYSGLKTSSHLVYSLAAKFAKAQDWDDCLLLNSHGRVCDSSIANIFWVKNNRVFTPPLSEGPVAGVMRKHILQKLSAEFSIEEKGCEISDLDSADEVFLTNAIRNIRWIERFREQSYDNEIGSHISKRLFS